jgi:hypothetical protein
MFNPNMNLLSTLLDVLFVEVVSFVVICSIHLALDICNYIFPFESFATCRSTLAYTVNLH